MQALVIGLGSIGKRLTKILIDHFKFKVFALRTEIKDDFYCENSQLFFQGTSWIEVEEFQPNIAFICNPTNYHISSAIECVKRGLPIMIEKPIDVTDNQLDDLIHLCEDMNVSSYIAYLLRFHPCIKFLKSNIDIDQVESVNVVCESYLPNWRQTDHLQSYSAYKDKGGGVILDLSHEFDYIQYLFGAITNLKGEFGKKSEVTVDSEDFMYAQMYCENIPINISLNYFTEKSKREILIKYKNGGQLLVDLLSSTIDKNGETIFHDSKTDTNSIYTEQLNYFINNINNKLMMNNIIEASELFKTLLTFRNGVKL